MKNKVSFFEIIKWIVAIFIVAFFSIVGSIFHVKGWYHNTVFSIVMIVLSVGWIVEMFVSCVMKRKFIDTLDRKNLQDELLAKRSHAAEIAQKLIDELKGMIHTMDFCAVVLLVSVCIIDFCFFAVVGVEGVGVCLPFVLGSYAGLRFVRSNKLKVNEKEQENYLAENDYPLIYDTARRAAKTVGCDGKIIIFVEHDFNAGIMSISDGYSIKLGTYVLDVMSREELYNILLHEFGHMVKKNDDINEVMNYAAQAETSEISKFFELPYIYLNAKFIFHYMSYQYVCSLMNEDAADAVMREHGDPKTAASMLIKLKFFELYDWELGTYDEINIFESETLIEDVVRRTIKMFRDRMELRHEEWMRLIDSEIISRTASHSTIKMRIDSLGVKDLKIITKNDTDEYLAEVEKVILMIESAVRKNLEPNYSLIRRQNYLNSKVLLDNWKNEGKPIKMLNYQGILLALHSSGKIDEFINLCCQIIEKITEPGNYFAHHMYGIYLLRCYDVKGIDHLYKSVELNHNSWGEAMEHIGRYACVTGNQDQLDKYRELMPDMMKEHKDVYGRMNSITTKDTLLPEVLPDGMLEAFLRYVQDLDKGRNVIDEIYIVRKIISYENFVSCVIVQPRRESSPVVFADVMESIYQFLDKSSDWKFSLFEMRSVPKILHPKIKKNRVYKGIIA